MEPRCVHPLIASFRAVVVLGSIAGYLYLCMVRELLLPMTRISFANRQRMRSHFASLGSRWIVWLLGFEVEVKGRRPEGPGLWVANHLSFWDILCLSSQVSPVYLTSVEVRNTPVIGWIAIATGCVFVERRNRNQIYQEISEVTSQLSNGLNVTLFPEGTSGDGTAVLPFKKSFFRAAVEAHVPVYPICINYVSIDGDPVGAHNRDQIFYYGEHEFWTQLFRAFSLRKVKVEVRFLDPLVAYPRETKSHEQLCHRSRESIHQHYQPLTS